MKRRSALLPLILFAALIFSSQFTASAIDTTEFYGEGSLILEAVPMEISPLKPPAVANAVEDVPGLKGLREIVSFKIEKIVRGKLEKTNLGEGSLTEELKTALEKKFFFATYDSSTSEKKLAGVPFNIAVSSAESTFEMTREELGKLKLRLYFRNYKQEATSLILIRSERLSADASSAS